MYQNIAHMTILFIRSNVADLGYGEVKTLFNNIWLQTAEVLTLKDVKT